MCEFPKFKISNLNNNILNRISYRFGIRYEDKAIQIENNYSADFGMSFGVDIPISVTSSSKDQYKSMSQIHLGVDYGSRGTTANGLIKENTTTFLVGFSMIQGNTDRWFRKRKIN